ncbi:MAG: hypothetical protein HY000_00950 [Planctomycetes bacterium]|nr:hypothetical protein [Planctomycetota bacterium]
MSSSWHTRPPEGHELAGFTARARKVLQLANQEAQRLNHDYIGTEHLLLGLVKEDVGVASQILSGLGFELRIARCAVEKVAPPNSHAATTGILPRDTRAKCVIEGAIEQAKKLKHPHVGTGHLLLALLVPEGAKGQQVLVESTICSEELRAKVVAVLQDTDWGRLEEFCLYGTAVRPANLLASATTSRRSHASSNLRDFLWALFIGGVVGLLTESWGVFAVTVGLVVLENLSRPLGSTP